MHIAFDRSYLLRLRCYLAPKSPSVALLARQLSRPAYFKGHSCECSMKTSDITVLSKTVANEALSTAQSRPSWSHKQISLRSLARKQFSFARRSSTLFALAPTRCTFLQLLWNMAVHKENYIFWHRICPGYFYTPFWNGYGQVSQTKRPSHTSQSLTSGHPRLRGPAHRTQHHYSTLQPKSGNRHYDTPIAAHLWSICVSVHDYLRILS